ncbi:MAG: hypothetical protein ABEJ98_05205 [Candidatus Nanohaloarchaea archaeon]
MSFAPPDIQKKINETLQKLGNIPSGSSQDQSSVPESVKQAEDFLEDPAGETADIVGNFVTSQKAKDHMLGLPAFMPGGPNDPSQGGDGYIDPSQSGGGGGSDISLEKAGLVAVGAAAAGLLLNKVVS